MGAIRGARRSAPSPTPPIDDERIPAHVLARGTALDTLARSIETYRSEGLTPTNAASLYAAGHGRLTVGFELIMAGEAAARPR